jgi:hypothetical protein
MDLKDGYGRVGGSTAGYGGAASAIWRLLPPSAAAGMVQGWPVEGQAGCAWRAAGAGAAARRSAERTEARKQPPADADFWSRARDGGVCMACIMCACVVCMRM